VKGAANFDGVCLFMKNSVCFFMKNNQVPPAYSRADLPIHAKTGRNWAPDCALSLTAVGDDEQEVKEAE
jgi:hypothetical protein